MDNFKQLEKKINKLIKENDEDHKLIRKKLFGNGDKGAMEQIRDNSDQIGRVAELLERSSEHTRLILQDLPIFIQETKNSIDEIKKIAQDNKVKATSNQKIIDKYVAQLGVWKWLVGFLG